MVVLKRGVEFVVPVASGVMRLQVLVMGGTAG